MNLEPSYHDITRPLHNALPPWPGDTAFDHRLTWRMDAGASVNVGALTMGTHNGTHADAPFHFLPDGARIDALDPAREFPADGAAGAVSDRLTR